MRNSKKGFTIVELVIVIAVIAILAAVLIPTFSSIIDKANESSALQKATNAQTLAVMELDGDVSGKTLYFGVEGTTTEGSTTYKYVFSYEDGDTDGLQKMVNEESNANVTAIPDTTNPIESAEISALGVDAYWVTTPVEEG